MEKKNIDSLEKFLEIVKEAGVSIHNGDPSVKENRYGMSYKQAQKKSKDTRPYICVQWSTGGMGGGSCWNDDEPSPYTNSDPPEELTELDTILENICPNITFLQYKNIVNKVVEHSNWTEYEYYGNSTDYAMKKCNLETLYSLLKEKFII